MHALCVAIEVCFIQAAIEASFRRQERRFEMSHLSLDAHHMSDFLVRPETIPALLELVEGGIWF